MAQVPTLEQNVFPQQGVQPQANGADFGAQVGAAQQGLGEQVSNTGDVIAKRVLAWQGLKNEATASDLDIQFQGDLGNVENGFYALKGKAAADAYPKFESDITALRQKYIGASPNPMVQNMLQQSVGYSIGRSLRQGGQYAGDQTKAWMVKSADSRNQLLVSQGARNYADPNYQAEVGTALDAGAKNYAELNGLDPASAEVYRQGLEADLQKGRIANAKAYLQGLPIAQQSAALLGVQPGTPSDVGGDAYHRTVLAVEFGSGQNDPNNPHQGPVQADDAWWKQYGAGGDRNDPKDALAALDRETADNKPKIEAALNRPATDSDLYLAHQQGLGGAIALLTHPDAPASSSVPLANIAANIPHDQNGQPVADASTITGQQFSDLWTKPFEAAGANGVGQGTAPSKGDLAAVAVLPADDRQQMTKAALENWRVQSNAAYEDQRHQQVAQEAAQKLQLDNADGQIQTLMLAHSEDPTKPAPSILQISQSPLYQGQPERVKRLMEFQKSLDHPPQDDGLDKATTAQLYRGILAGTVKPQDVQDAFAPPDNSPGKISKANLQFLQGVLKNGGDSADAKSTAALKTTFLKTAEQGIKANPVETTDGSDNTYNFDFDFEKAWQDKIAKGENPKDLITPGNKDYFGSLNNLAHYSQTAADALAAEKEGPGFLSLVWNAVNSSTGIVPPSVFAPTQPGVSQPVQPAEYKTMADIQSAINRHEISLADGKKYAIDHGIGRVVPKTAAESGPAAPND